MDNEKLICPICGAKTSGCYGNYRKDRLCKKHGEMLDNGELRLDESGKYVSTKKEAASDELTCIICGEPSNGKHFCLKCYHKYKSRTIGIEIKNCREFTITDAYGNHNVKTANGLYVRSKSEKIIYDEFLRRKINCEYERTISYKDEEGNIKDLHPDFYLPDYNLYIEHWGYLDAHDEEYEETKKYKEKIYQIKGYKLAATTSKDINDIQGAIEKLLLEHDIVI